MENIKTYYDKNINGNINRLKLIIVNNYFNYIFASILLYFLKYNYK